jgi:hypothetical protein
LLLSHSVVPPPWTEPLRRDRHASRATDADERGRLQARILPGPNSFQPARLRNWRCEGAKACESPPRWPPPYSSPGSCLKRQQEVSVCRTFKPSDGLEPSTPPYHGGSQGVLAGTHGHSRSCFSCASWRFTPCRECPRVPATGREGTLREHALPRSAVTCPARRAERGPWRTWRSMRVYAVQQKPVASGRGVSGLAGRSPGGSSSL